MPGSRHDEPAKQMWSLSSSYFSGLPRSAYDIETLKNKVNSH